MLCCLWESPGYAKQKYEIGNERGRGNDRGRGRELQNEDAAREEQKQYSLIYHLWERLGFIKQKDLVRNKNDEVGEGNYE